MNEINILFGRAKQLKNTKNQLNNLYNERQNSLNELNKLKEQLENLKDTEKIKTVEEKLKEVEILIAEQNLEKQKKKNLKSIEIFGINLEGEDFLCLNIPKAIKEAIKEEEKILTEKLSEFDFFSFENKIYKNENFYFLIGKPKIKKTRIKRKIETKNFINITEFLNKKTFITDFIGEYLVKNIKNYIYKFKDFEEKNTKIFNEKINEKIKNFNENFLKNTKFEIKNVEEAKVDVFVKNLIKFSKTETNFFNKAEFFTKKENFKVSPATKTLANKILILNSFNSTRTEKILAAIKKIVVKMFKKTENCSLKNLILKFSDLEFLFENIFNNLKFKISKNDEIYEKLSNSLKIEIEEILKLQEIFEKSNFEQISSFYDKEIENQSENIKIYTLLNEIFYEKLFENLEKNLKTPKRKFSAEEYKKLTKKNFDNSNFRGKEKFNKISSLYRVFNSLNEQEVREMINDDVLYLDEDLVAKIISVYF